MPNGTHDVSHVIDHCMVTCSGRHVSVIAQAMSLSSAQKEYLAFGLLGLIPLLYRGGQKQSNQVKRFSTKFIFCMGVAFLKSKRYFWKEKKIDDSFNLIFWNIKKKKKKKKGFFGLLEWLLSPFISYVRGGGRLPLPLFRCLPSWT